MKRSSKLLLFALFGLLLFVANAFGDEKSSAGHEVVNAVQLELTSAESVDARGSLSRPSENSRENSPGISSKILRYA